MVESLVFEMKKHTSGIQIVVDSRSINVNIVGFPASCPCRKSAGFSTGLGNISALFAQRYRLYYKSGTGDHLWPDSAQRFGTQDHRSLDFECLEFVASALTTVAAPTRAQDLPCDRLASLRPMPWEFSGLAAPLRARG